MSTLNLTRPIHPADYEHICKHIKLHHHQKLGSSSLWVIKPDTIAPTEAKCSHSPALSSDLSFC